MTQTLDQLGGKTAGQLIRHEDWNDLVQNLKEINATLAGQIATAAAQIAALTTTVGQLHSEFDVFRNRVDPVIGQFYQVRITTTRTRFAIGEPAEIEAQVSDPLDGQLQRAGEAGRPWVDFVATWGQLKPAPGFESVAGTGDRSISVRVNEQGIARALLRADHLTGFSDLEEIDVTQALDTPVLETAKSAARFIIEAETPMAAKNAGVFQMMTAEYESATSPAFRKFTDAYYVKNAPGGSPTYRKLAEVEYSKDPASTREDIDNSRKYGRLINFDLRLVPLSFLVWGLVLLAVGIILRRRAARKPGATAV